MGGTFTLSATTVPPLYVRTDSTLTVTAGSDDVLLAASEAGAVHHNVTAEGCEVIDGLQREGGPGLKNLVLQPLKVRRWFDDETIDLESGLVAGG